MPTEDEDTELIEHLQSLYEYIGTCMVASLPETWHSAWIVAETEPDGLSITTAYESEEDGEPVGFVPAEPENVGLALIDLRQTMAAVSGDAPFEKAAFIISPDGEASLLLDYDDDVEDDEA